MTPSSINRTARAALVAVVAAIVATLLVATPAPASAAIDSDAEWDFVRLINAERRQRGEASLAVATDLVGVARSHSQDMARLAKLHHNPDLGDDVSNWRRLAENVGVGYDVARLHDAFMDSAGHRANILDDRVTQVGIGVHEASNGRIWVTVVFRLPVDASKTTTVTSTSSSTGTLQTGGTAARLPGGEDVRPVSGDWDGNGSVTPGWFIDGYFHLSNRHDGSGSLISFKYGCLAFEMKRGSC